MGVIEEFPTKLEVFFTRRFFYVITHVQRIKNFVRYNLVRRLASYGRECKEGVMFTI